MFAYFLGKLKPTKVKGLEFDKYNNLHPVSYLGKAITFKRNEIESQGWSSFEDLEKFFPTFIWLLIFAFFLTKL